MPLKLNLQVSEGESYTRCHQIIIDNRLDAEPAITFAQEQIVTVAGRVMHMPLPPVALTFDPEGIIAILDPDTGTPTGATVTQAEAYALLFSTYVAAATATPETEEE